MSDFDKNLRKKKVLASPRDKEFTPRKPVILVKNDKETKETVPVIMIKPRETSAVKDVDNRPASPKKNEAEAPVTVVPQLKIAQNEQNKEKKLAETKIVAPPSPMIRPSKLVDDYLDFSQAPAEYLLESNTNFLVVGIVGGQGVGKSTIMNILAHSSDLTKLHSEILYSHELIDDPSTEDNQHRPAETHTSTESEAKITTNSAIINETKRKPLIFKCQDMKQIEMGQPCSIGIDMYVTDNRIILLDTGPIFNAGGSRVLGNATFNSLPRGGLEISAFLLAVCHVVILAQDWFVDFNMLRFMQSAEMVKPSIPAASNQNISHSGVNNSDNDANSSKDYYPHMLFVQNKCSMDDFNPESIKLMQEMLSKSFCKSNLNIHSGLYMYDIESKSNVHQIYHNLNAEKCGKPVNLFLIPMLSENNDEHLIYRGHPTIEELGHRFRSLVFGAARNQLTNVPLNEKTWLQYANKTWENIKKSTFFNEYNRLLP